MLLDQHLLQSPAPTFPFAAGGGILGDVLQMSSSALVKREAEGPPKFVDFSEADPQEVKVGRSLGESFLTLFLLSCSLSVSLQTWDFVLSPERNHFWVLINIIGSAARSLGFIITGAPAYIGVAFNWQNDPAVREN